MYLLPKIPQKRNQLIRLDTAASQNTLDINEPSIKSIIDRHGDQLVGIRPTKPSSVHWIIFGIVLVNQSGARSSYHLIRFKNAL